MAEPPDNVTVTVTPQANNPLIEVHESDPEILDIQIDEEYILRGETMTIPIRYRAKHLVDITWEWSKNFDDESRHTLESRKGCMNVASTSITVDEASSQDAGHYFLTIKDGKTGKTATTHFQLVLYSRQFYSRPTQSSSSWWCTVV